MAEIKIPLTMTDSERDTVAYAAYSKAHDQMDARYAMLGLTDDGEIIMRPIAERIEAFRRWRIIGDAITATRFNRPTWSLVDEPETGSTHHVPQS